MALSSSHGVSNECKDFLLSLIEHLEDVSLENILFLFLNVGEGFFSFFFFGLRDQLCKCFCGTNRSMACVVT